MALILNSEETNDGTILYLTDASTWGSDSVPAFADVDSVALTVQYETPDGVSVVYNFDAQTIFTTAQGLADPSLLIYPITMVSLGIGAATDPLPDGIYTINYSVVDNAVTTDMDQIGILCDALIKTEVYRIVGDIQYQYYANNNYYTKQIDDALLIQSLYDSMQASAWVAKQEEIIKVLETLQRLTQ